MGRSGTKFRNKWKVSKGNKRSSNFPLAKMDVIHKLTETNGKLYITHRIEISGLTTFLFSKIIGEKIISGLPNALHNLSNLAKNL